MTAHSPNPMWDAAAFLVFGREGNVRFLVLYGLEAQEYLHYMSKLSRAALAGVYLLHKQKLGR